MTKSNSFVKLTVYGGDKLDLNQASPSDISAFLDQAKKLLTEDSYRFVPRRKNLEALSEHGLTIEDAKNEIISLVVGDYYKGPKQDFDPTQPGDVWEFKKDLDGKKFYVKLKIQKIDGNDVLKCLSFHEDDFS